MSDLIDRQAAIDALWKALFEYEDKTEKQFLESDELDISDWMQHRIFVQHMSDIDRETILNLPSAEPELDEWCTDCKEYDQERHCCPRWNRVIRQTLKDAELERKKGRWQITDAYPHNVYCSECHIKFAQKHWAVWEDGSLPRNFCPNCGAEMTEGENE